MTMHYTRTGRGKPLLLVHGLGATCGSWDTISPALSRDREIIAPDLPGHGKTSGEADSGTFEGLARSLDDWLEAENLTGIDMVGSSLGARLVLEMARRGHRADPGRHCCSDQARVARHAARRQRPVSAGPQRPGPYNRSARRNCWACPHRGRAEAPNLALCRRRAGCRYSALVNPARHHCTRRARKLAMARMDGGKSLGRVVAVERGQQDDAECRSSSMARPCCGG